MSIEQPFDTQNIFPERPDMPRIIIEIFSSHDNFYKRVRESYRASKKGGYEVGTPSFYKQIIGGIKMSKVDWRKCVDEIKKVVNGISASEEELNEGINSRQIKEADGLTAEEDRRRMGLTDEYEEFKE